MTDEHSQPVPPAPLAEADSHRGPVSSDALYGVLAREAGGYYQMTVAAATAYLGATLLLIRTVMPHPSVPALLLLAVGGLSLSAAILTVGEIRRVNLKSLHLAMEAKYAEAKPLDERNETRTAMAQWLLAIGMVAVTSSVIVGLWPHGKAEGTMAKEDVDKIITKDDRGGTPLHIGGSAAGGAPATRLVPGENNPQTPPQEGKEDSTK